MLFFLEYLKNFEQENTSKTEAIIKEKWDKTIDIIKAAFGESYTTKEYALHKIQNEFVKKAPEKIDVNFLKENMDYVINKINNLNEGEIKIIINNDVNKVPSTYSNCPVANTSPTTSSSKPVVVTGGEIGGEIDIEMECVNSKNSKNSKKNKKDNKKENINKDEETEETKIKKESDEENEEKIIPENNETKETQKEDRYMNKNNTISWRDIEGIDLDEEVNENTNISVNVNDMITVDGKKYKVTEVIPNEKKPMLSIVKVSTNEAFALGEIDKVETIKEGVHKSAELLEEKKKVKFKKDKETKETKEEKEEKEKIKKKKNLKEDINTETDETDKSEVEPVEDEKMVDVDLEKEESETEEEKDYETQIPKEGDKVTIKDREDTKFLVLKVDEEENEITVEDEDGEELIFKLEDIEEIEKSEENSEEESEEESEKKSEKDAKDSYDPQGDEIHENIQSALRIIREVKNGMPKIPASANIPKSSPLSKVNAPHDMGTPKQPANRPATGGKTINSHNMAHAEDAPKITGVSTDIIKKDKTASGYTQKPMKHSMPQAQSAPDMPLSVKISSNKALDHKMPHSDEPPENPLGNKLTKKGTSITHHTMPHDQGSPSMPASGKVLTGKGPANLIEQYYAKANKFFA